MFEESEVHLLSHHIFSIKAMEAIKTLEKGLTINRYGEFSAKGIKAFASLMPAIANASKWSKEYLFDVILR